MTVTQTSNRAVINWQSFKVSEGFSVRFDQIDQSAMILNRVTGANVSTIDGTISSNGQVFLINPNGIVIGQSGVVRADGGFVASTLDIADQDFLDGRLNFAGSGRSIVNSGLISSGVGGYVALLGGSIRNEGVISVPSGKIGIGAGERVTLDLNGGGFLQVLAPSASEHEWLIDNTGAISAEGGLIHLSARAAASAVRQTVNTSGTLDVRRASVSGGVIKLEGGPRGTVTIGGRIDASSQDGAGGRIDITGEGVDLVEFASVHADGATGGLVRIGGSHAGTAAVDALARFGTLSVLDEAASLTIGADAQVTAFGTQGPSGAIVLRAAQNVAVNGFIETGSGEGNLITGTDGFVSISSGGTIDALNAGRIRVGGGIVSIGADRIEVFGERNDAAFGDDDFGSGDHGGGDAFSSGGIGAVNGVTRISASFLDRLGGGGLQRQGDLAVQLEATRDLSWVDGTRALFGFVNLADRLSSLQLTAGGSVSLQGDFALSGVDLDVRAGVMGANGGLRPSFTDNRINWFANVNPLIDDGGNILDFRLRNLSLSLAGSTNDVAALSFIDLANDISVRGAVSLTGNIQVSVSDLAVVGDSVTWNSEQNSAIMARSDLQRADIRFVSSGILTRLGALKGFDATRLDLGGIPLGVYPDINAGDALDALQPLRIVRGNLRAGDQLDALLAPGSIVAATGPQGDSGLFATASGALAFAPGIAGYFVDLTPVRFAVDAPPLVDIIARLQPARYVYGTPSKILDLISSAPVTGVLPVFSLMGGVLGSATEIAGTPIGTGLLEWSLPMRQAAGTYSVSLARLSGSNAGAFNLVREGPANVEVVIAPRPITFSIADQSRIYGDASAVSATLGNLLVGDDVTARVELFNSGQLATLGARNPVGTYIASATALFGEAAGNYVLAGDGNRDGLITITPRLLRLANASAQYGDLPTPMFANLLEGDDVTASFLTGPADALPLMPLSNRLTPGIYTLGIEALLGADAGNYAIGQDGESNSLLTISRRQIRLPEINALYGELAPLQSFSFNESVTGDLIRVSLCAQVGGLCLSDTSQVQIRRIGNEYVRFLNTYALQTLSVFEGSDRFEILGGDFVLAPRPLFATLSPSEIVYGDAANLLRVSGLVNGDDLLIQSRFGERQLQQATASTGINLPAPGTAPRFNVGNYNFLIQSITSLPGSNALANYDISALRDLTADFTIIPREIGAVVQPSSRIYGSNSLPTVQFSGLVAGDTLQAVFRAEGMQGLVDLANDRLRVGQYNVNVTGLQGEIAQNYRLADSGNVGGIFTITPRSVSLIALEGGLSRVYGDRDDFGLSGILAGDAVSLSGLVITQDGGLSTVRTPVGTYGILSARLSGLDAENYVYTQAGPNPTLTIFRRPVSLASLSDLRVQYGEALTSLSDLQNLVEGDEVFVMSQLVNGSPDPVTGRLDVGIYQRIATGLFGTDASNYLFTGPNAQTIEITPRNLRLAAVESVIYGNVRPALSFSSASGLFEFQGQLAGDEITVTAIADGRTSPAGFLNVGTYTLQDIALGGAKGRNYRLIGADDLTVTPRALNVFAAQNQVYGTSDDFGNLALTAPQIEGLLPNDDTDLVFRLVGQGLNQLLASGAASDLPRLIANARLGVGTYQILAETADGANYIIGSEASQLTITPRLLTGAQRSIVYGARPDELAAASLLGVLDGDTVFAGVDFGDEALSSSGRVRVGVRQAALNGLFGQDSANYRLIDDSATFVVSQRILNPSFLENLGRAFQRTYGEVDVDLTEIERLINIGAFDGDDVALDLNFEILDRGGIFGSRLGVGDYSLSISQLRGNDFLNYALSDDARASSFDLVVTPRPLFYDIGDITSTFGDRTFATPTIALSNVIDGDNVLADLELVRFVLQDVGTYALSPVNLIGAASENYRISSVGSRDGTLTITPRRLQAAYSLETFRLSHTPDPFGEMVGSIDREAETVTLERGQENRFFYGQVSTGFAKTILSDPSGVFSAGELASLAIDASLPLNSFGLLNAGSYILAGGVNSGNFVLEDTATLNILRQPLGLFDSVYGNSDPTRLAPGVIADITLAPVAGALGAPSTVSWTRTTNAGLYRIVSGTLSGADADNYEAPTGSLVRILPRHVRSARFREGSDLTEVLYGTLRAETSLQLLNAVEGDDINLRAVYRFADQGGDAFTNQNLRPELFGTSASNYVIGPNSGLDRSDFFGSVRITPRPIEPLGTILSRTTYGDSFYEDYARFLDFLFVRPDRTPDGLRLSISTADARAQALFDPRNPLTASDAEGRSFAFGGEISTANVGVWDVVYRIMRSDGSVDTNFLPTTGTIEVTPRTVNATVFTDGRIFTFEDTFNGARRPNDGFSITGLAPHDMAELTRLQQSGQDISGYLGLNIATPFAPSFGPVSFSLDFVNGEIRAFRPDILPGGQYAVSELTGLRGGNYIVDTEQLRADPTLVNFRTGITIVYGGSPEIFRDGRLVFEGRGNLTAFLLPSTASGNQFDFFRNNGLTLPGTGLLSPTFFFRSSNGTTFIADSSVSQFLPVGGYSFDIVGLPDDVMRTFTFPNFGLRVVPRPISYSVSGGLFLQGLGFTGPRPGVVEFDGVLQGDSVPFTLSVRNRNGDPTDFALPGTPESPALSLRSDIPRGEFLLTVNQLNPNYVLIDDFGRFGNRPGDIVVDGLEVFNQTFAPLKVTAAVPQPDTNNVLDYTNGIKVPNVGELFGVYDNGELDDTFRMFNIFVKDDVARKQILDQISGIEGSGGVFSIVKNEVVYRDLTTGYSAQINFAGVSTGGSIQYNDVSLALNVDYRFPKKVQVDKAAYIGQGLIAADDLQFSIGNVSFDVGAGGRLGGVGGHFSKNIGLNQDRLKVQFSVGVVAGLGFNLDVNFEVDFGSVGREIVGGLTTAGKAVGCAIGLGGCSRPKTEQEKFNDRAKDWLKLAKGLEGKNPLAHLDEYRRVLDAMPMPARTSWDVVHAQGTLEVFRYIQHQAQLAADVIEGLPRAAAEQQRLVSAFADDPMSFSLAQYRELKAAQELEAKALRSGNLLLHDSGQLMRIRNGEVRIESWDRYFRM